MSKTTRSSIIVVGSIVSVLLLVALGAVEQENAYKQAVYDNCKQYDVVPEKYISRVPDGCVSQYFKGKQGK